MPSCRTPIHDNRARFIATLAARVAELQAEGLSERAAIRKVASESGLHPMLVKRLAILYPEA